VKPPFSIKTIKAHQKLFVPLKEKEKRLTFRRAKQKAFDLKAFCFFALLLRRSIEYRASSLIKKEITKFFPYLKPVSRIPCPLYVGKKMVRRDKSWAVIYAQPKGADCYILLVCF